MKLKLQKIPLDKAKFNAAPLAERIFFIKVANLLSEMTILKKCMLASLRVGCADPNSIQDNAQSVQAMLFIKLLAGFLKEGREMIAKDYFGKKLKDQYEEMLSGEARLALKSITQYFNKKDNLICMVRDNVAFHFDADHDLTEQGLNDLSSIDDFSFYLNDMEGNCFYKAANHLNIKVLLSLTKKDNLEEAILILKDEVSDQAQHFQDFFGEFIAQFISLRMSEVFQCQEKEKEIDVMSADSIKLPFFFGNDTAAVKFMKTLADFFKRRRA